MNVGKGNKNPNEARKNKVADETINGTSDVAKKAKEQAEEDRKARAKAAGLDENATLESIVEAETKAAQAAEIAKHKTMEELKEKNHKLWALTQHIETIFADRAKTNQAGVTETELKASVGHTGASANLQVVYSDKEETKGYVTLEEFDVKVRVPEKGEFTFGPDYARINARIAEENAKKA